MSWAPCHGVINVPIKSLAKNYSPKNFIVAQTTTSLMGSDGCSVFSHISCHYAGCPKTFARIRRTQNPFSGYIYLMCRRCWHMSFYWLSVFYSIWFSFLSWKSLLYMYCLKSWKERQSTRVVLLFQNATIFMFYSVLNTIKSNFKTICY